MHYAAFLRAVNVAQTWVSMSELKAMFTALGFADPQSLLQSGNIIFGADKRRANDLEALLERETKKRLKVDTQYFVRDVKELERIIDRNPFTREAKNDPAHLVVVFLKRAPDAENLSALQSSIKGRETVRAGERHIYVTYPDGQGRSKLTNAVIERTFGCAGTARNWNTVVKVAQALGELGRGSTGSP